ncbi:MAG: monovalent cation/H+ antiporter subunit D, partial [Sphingomonadales bacterium]|nr:monovalent cation/H+ antiporter subunit D [Sphingomonadales bacterium]
MDHLIVAPIVIPALTAAIALLVMRRRRRLGAAISLGGCVAALIVAVALLAVASDDAIRSYAIGGWRAPFGIVLVLDRLSAAMLVLASALALVVMIHAVATAADRRGWHFHPLFQFQLLGLNGAFLTGDLFNLFVFFEVLLIASYGLMLHGQGAARLKAGVAYVVVNIVGSALFLIALGLLYGLAGTLNMADLGVRIAMLPPGDGGVVRSAGLLLTAVFALKAAVVPLHLWLPRTYAATMPVVAALFAIMTKVGVYAMIRVVPLVFGATAGEAAWVPSPWLAPAAIVTAVLGFGGVLAARGLRESAAFAVMGSTGSLLLVLAAWTPAATGATLFYMLNATLAGAALFLVADVAMRRRGQFGDAVVATPRFAGQNLVALLYMAACIGAVGLPPLAGFIGKLLMLRATVGVPGQAVIWATILGTTLVGVIGFARTGSAVFWKVAAGDARLACADRGHSDYAGPAAAIGLLVLLSVFAGPVSTWADAAARQLFAADRYVAAVLGPQA